MRGKKPVPSHLKLIRGNPGRRPIDISREPQPAVMAPPAPPFVLTPEAMDEWDHIVPQLLALHLITPLDWVTVAVMCQHYGDYVACRKAFKDMAADAEHRGMVLKAGNGGLISNPLLVQSRKAADAYLKFAECFGMTPSARTRIRAIESGEVRDPTADYFA